MTWHHPYLPLHSWSRSWPRRGDSGWWAPAAWPDADTECIQVQLLQLQWGSDTADYSILWHFSESLIELFYVTNTPQIIYRERICPRGNLSYIWNTIRLPYKRSLLCELCILKVVVTFKVSKGCPTTRPTTPPNQPAPKSHQKDIVVWWFTSPLHAPCQIQSPKCTLTPPPLLSFLCATCFCVLPLISVRCFLGNLPTHSMNPRSTRRSTLSSEVFSIRKLILKVSVVRAMWRKFLHMEISRHWSFSHLNDTTVTTVITNELLKRQASLLPLDLQMEWKANRNFWNAIKVVNFTRLYLRRLRCLLLCCATETGKRFVSSKRVNIYTLNYGSPDTIWIWIIY